MKNELNTPLSLDEEQVVIHYDILEDDDSGYFFNFFYVYLLSRDGKHRIEITPFLKDEQVEDYKRYVQEYEGL